MSQRFSSWRVWFAGNVKLLAHIRRKVQLLLQCVKSRTSERDRVNRCNHWSYCTISSWHCFRAWSLGFPCHLFLEKFELNLIRLNLHINIRDQFGLFSRKNTFTGPSTNSIISLARTRPNRITWDDISNAWWQCRYRVFDKNSECVLC